MALNNKQVKTLLIFLMVVIGIFILFIFIYSKKAEKLGNGYVKINNKIIAVEIASSEAQHYQGLSNRADLCLDCGMLFVFPDYQIRKFVMRNMNFPLDIIFINDGKIINIEKNLAPEGINPNKIYQSVLTADKVLEVNGNYCDTNNIKIGDNIILNN